MSISIRVIDRTVTLTAPVSGRLRLIAPRALCGELEVFTAGEPVLGVGGALLGAPGDGFVLRARRKDGEQVGQGEPVVDYRIVGSR